MRRLWKQAARAGLRTTRGEMELRRADALGEHPDGLLLVLHLGLELLELLMERVALELLRELVVLVLHLLGARAQARDRLGRLHLGVERLLLLLGGRLLERGQVLEHDELLVHRLELVVELLHLGADLLVERLDLLELRLALREPARERAERGCVRARAREPEGAREEGDGRGGPGPASERECDAFSRLLSRGEDLEWWAREVGRSCALTRG